MGQFGICRSIFSTRSQTMKFPQASEPGAASGGQDPRSVMNTAGHGAHSSGGGASPIALNKTVGVGSGPQQQPPQEHIGSTMQRNGTPSSGRPAVAQQRGHHGFVGEVALA